MAPDRLCATIPEVLRCEECHVVCEYAKGWIAHLIQDDEEPDHDSYAVLYCSAWAARDFGWVSSRSDGSRSPDSSPAASICAAGTRVFAGKLRGKKPLWNRPE